MSPFQLCQIGMQSLEFHEPFTKLWDKQKKTSIWSYFAGLTLNAYIYQLYDFGFAYIPNKFDKSA